MTRPTDDITPFKPFGGRLGINLLQYLGAIALLGIGLSVAAYVLN